MVPDLNVNDFTIIFEVEKLDRPFGGHSPDAQTHEVKVRRIIDRQTGRDVAPGPHIAPISYGKGADDAYQKVVVPARRWAEAQPTERS
ncbi:hypothetical protein [Mycobacteroides chelonae]|uniref:hypothetical protein n=1 Tax=Mycobacteroides chelonae TaxID=1774 RepID=UPI000992E5AD|nr:hypothetical protein [Mycobacteroides chelonae]